MRSERIQKRHGGSPQTVRERLPGAGGPPRRLRQQLVWLLLIPLTLLAAWAANTMHRTIARSISDELQLVLAAEVELAKAMLGESEGEPDPSTSTYAAQFARALSGLPVLSRIGRTGETYAFDRNGVMLTPSRFERELSVARLFTQRAGRTVVELRDPGGRVSAGHVPDRARSQQPFTFMVREALAGRDGVDVRGYRDYRGVEVVGAWRWLAPYGLGVAVEIDSEEAFALNDGLWKALIAVYIAMAFALIAVGGSTRAYQRARTRIAEAEQLGQYTLVRELGRGGMGTVYEARHALLRRPTAVKLMTAESEDPAAEADALLRFEREVQLTSQLSHPNTVVIYDYGREGGVFYYAMEYIDGVDLDALVRKDGPLPAGRAIHFALQICGSLTEAHDKQLIHRDIKPANVLICERGGLPDTIKVLDFGLVKSLLGPQVSAAHVLVGTPQFMAPEVLHSPSAADVRSDIYALGALLYWLCTGHTVFENLHVVSAIAPSAAFIAPSVHRPDLPIDLERVIVRCLAREPLERPASMSEVAAELRACRAHGSWSVQDARRYWRERGDSLVRGLPAAPDVPTVAAR